MKFEHVAMLEWCVYRSQEHAITDDDTDRLYLSDISGGRSILMTSRKSISDVSTEAYKAVLKSWNKLHDTEKDKFRALVQIEDM